MVSHYKFGRCVTLCALFTINLFLLIVTFLFLYISPYIVKETNNIAQNWNNTVILDIKLTKDKCPFRYQPLVLGYTNSISMGLYCLKDGRTFNYSGETFEGLERNDYVQRGCYPAYEKPRTPIYVWRNTIICVYKSIFPTYVDLKAVLPYSNCQSNLIKCPHPYDTLNEFMCVRHLSECGINYLKVIDISETYDSNKYTKLNFNDGKKSLLVGRGIPGLPTIIDFQVVKGKVCAFPIERFLFQNQSYLLYESFNYNNGCETKINGYNYNPYYTLLDSDTELSVLTSNGIEYRDLPLYPIKYLENEDYNLHYTTYVGFQGYCEWYLPDIRSYINIHQLDQEHNSGSIGIIVMCFLNIIFIFFGFCAFYCTRDDRKACDCYHFIYFIISSFVSFLICWIYYSSYMSVAFYQYLYEYYVNIGMNCLDSFHTALVTNQNSFTAYYPNFYLVLAIWYTFLFCLTFIFPMFYCCLKDCFDWNFFGN